MEPFRIEPTALESAGEQINDVVAEIASASAALGMKDRTARKVLAALLEDGILDSDTAKGPVHLKFDASSAEQLFPNLFQATV